MHLDLTHTFSKEEAISRVKTALAQGRAQLREHASIEEERWDGDTLHFAFTAQGQHISGTMRVTDTHFVVDAKLPLMLRLFEGRIEKEIQKQVATALGQA